MAILEYKRRLLKRRPGEQKVGIEGISATSQEEASTEEGGQEKCVEGSRNGGGAVAVVRQVPLEWQWANSPLGMVAQPIKSGMCHALVTPPLGRPVGTGRSLVPI